MDALKELGTILGGTAIAVAALAWLAKSLLTHYLSKDIEKHKATLTAQNALESERLRAELTKQALEHEVRFRRVDEKVAEHLDHVYRHLFRFYESVCSYVRDVEWSCEPSKEEKLEAASKANRAFWDYFLVNRVYLPPTLFQRVRQLADKLTQITNEFTRGLRREEKGFVREDDGDHWSEALNAVEKEATPLFTAIVREVQERLGVHDETEGTSENTECGDQDAKDNVADKTALNL